MGVGSELQELGRFLDDCERRAEAVDSLDVAEVTGVGDHRLTADLELKLSVDAESTGGTTLCDPRVGPDGTVRFALEPAVGLPLSTDHDVDVEPTDVVLDADGTVTVTLAATVPAETSTQGEKGAGQPTRGGTANGNTTGDGGDEGTVLDIADAADADEPTDTRGVPGPDESSEAGNASGPVESSANGDGTGTVESTDGTDPTDIGAGLDTPSTPTSRRVPPFKDPELLAEVYDSCDTFAQMAEALEMDVTGETVRRYMIEHDIHEPTTYKTSDDTAASQPVVLSDGIGLPDDVTVETLIETVQTSNTIRQVKQDIDVDREDALEMLKELNLLDLVVGRLATEGEREITREDVVECLRDASAVQ